MTGLGQNGTDVYDSVMSKSHIAKDARKEACNVSIHQSQKALMYYPSRAIRAPFVFLCRLTTS